MVRLGKGETFGKVIVGLPSMADPSPSPPGDTSPGLDIPEDVSQPVRTNEWHG